MDTRQSRGANALSAEIPWGIGSTSRCTRPIRPIPLRGGAVLEHTATKYPTGAAFCGHQGYRGTVVTFVHAQLGLELHIVPRLGEGVVVKPKRWVVERTFAWLGHFRRLAKDVELLTGTAENVIRIAMLKTTLAKC